MINDAAQIAPNTPREALRALAHKHLWCASTFPGSCCDTYTRGPAGPEQAAVIVWWYADHDAQRHIASAAFRVGGREGRGVAVAHPGRRRAEVEQWITAPGER